MRRAYSPSRPGLVALPLLAAALAVLSLSPAAAQGADTLLSQGKPATASSVEAAYVAANAVDGSTATRWSSAFSDPQWIYVDLGATVTISRVVLNWEAAYGKAYQIQVSNDATNWTTIYAVTNGTGGVNDLTVSGSGRYVRMYGTARGTRYGYSLWEFQVYGTQVSTEATLLSQGKTATASSVQAAFVAANGVDGKAATRWSSAFSDPQWIYVDLGATATISRVVLNWEAAYGKAYQIQVSDDATSWTTISTVTNGAGDVNDLTVSGSGRYVRMYGTARGTRYGYSLWEFQVYGTAGGSGPTPTTCSTLPSAPTGLAASSVSSTSVTLSWNASTPGANCSITGYRVYQNGVQTAAPTGTTASLSGLAPSTTYSFTVAAVNAFGASAQSAALSVAAAPNDSGGPGGLDSGLGAPPFAPGELDAASHGGTMTFQQIGAAGWYPSLRDPAVGPCDVTHTATCCRATHTLTGDQLTPWNEDLILTLRGPMLVKQLAVYQPDPGDASTWRLVSAWDSRSAPGPHGLAFHGNGTESAGFSGSVGTECLVDVSTDLAFPCGQGSVPYCAASAAEQHRGWAGSKLFVLLARMPHAGSAEAGQACSKDATGNWYDAPWIGLSVGELVRAGSFATCQCYAKDPAQWWLADGCGQFNAFEVVNDNGAYKNLGVFSTNFIGYAGYVGEGPCGPQCDVSKLPGSADLIAKSTGTEAAQGAVANPGQGPGAAFRRPDQGYRYFVVLLDVASRTVQLAVIHPSAVPATAAVILPALPPTATRAAVADLLQLHLPR